MHRGFRMLGVLTLAGCLAVGCSSEGASRSTSAASPLSANASEGAVDRAQPGPQQAAPGSPGERPPATPEQAGPSAATGTAPAAADLATKDRKLARTANATLRVKDVARAAARARDIAAGLGGYVGLERTSEDSATLALAVPGEKLDQALDRIARIAPLTTREVTVEDVTDAVVDVQSRIASQRRSVARARALLDQAKTIGEIVTVEEEVAEREAELESLLARHQALTSRVAMASITVTITRDDVPAGQQDDDTGFLAGLAGGWDAFTTMLAAVATGIGAAAPFVLVLALPGVAVVLWLRRRRNRNLATESR